MAVSLPPASSIQQAGLHRCSSQWARCYLSFPVLKIHIWTQPAKSVADHFAVQDADFYRLHNISKSFLFFLLGVIFKGFPVVTYWACVLFSEGTRPDNTKEMSYTVILCMWSLLCQHFFIVPPPPCSFPTSFHNIILLSPYIKHSPAAIDQLISHSEVTSFNCVSAEHVQDLHKIVHLFCILNPVHLLY